MDILNGYLESIEAPCLGHLHLGTEPLNKVLIDNAIAGSEKCQNMLDEVLFLCLMN